jgi:GAF domain-containing protein
MRFTAIVGTLLSALGVVIAAATGGLLVIGCVAVTGITVTIAVYEIIQHLDYLSPDCLDSIRALTPSSAALAKDGCREHLRQATQSISDAIGAQVGEPVSACLQIAQAREVAANAWLEDVARDAQSEHWTDDLRRKGIRQYLHASSSQHHVAANAGEAYCCHDVSQDLTFQCPLLGVVKSDHSVLLAWPVLGPWIRRWRWQLYRSRIVVAVWSADHTVIIGFLSVTSRKAFAFRERREVALLQMMATQLSRPLEVWIAIRQAEINERQSEA